MLFDEVGFGRALADLAYKLSILKSDDDVMQCPNMFGRGDKQGTSM